MNEPDLGEATRQIMRLLSAIDHHLEQQESWNRDLEKKSGKAKVEAGASPKEVLHHACHEMYFAGGADAIATARKMLKTAFEGGAGIVDNGASHE